MEDIKRNRLRYRLHYKLRQHGCKIVTSQRYVVKQSREMTPIAEKYCKQLISMGYCVQNPIFEL